MSTEFFAIKETVDLGCYDGAELEFVAKECRSLKPRFVAQIEFTEWTPDGHPRHPSFLGLRDDKDVQTVMRDKLMLQSS